ncbi:prepilin-type N-terminal cleavage/methylation domain-containing protein [Prosthecobacter fusiformis]|uniref:Prepilin-type N-terminal cleavage/methylation domain-containing protein n=1 Tax=Prosthecobacter fusiformis TaxID=48464 RepID=A0A4R7RZR1_9BACT|nr:prepilin-type N-terminal cleavage/methylation domain-containing protein [Prosthecobacter fusiformis]TDU71361.1 prepilin-type N-terminal cleavage/methylation domain-containing protein [Prosthecobacter fusiformis]
MNTNLKHLHPAPRQAFSLTEMLIVIAVIGILSSIAITYLGGVHRETMLQIRDQRNAQEVVGLSMGAIASGAPVVQPGDMRTTIGNLIEGRKATTGAFSGRTFRLSQLDEEEITGAMRYLSWQEDQPVYVFQGN